jgi:hypothetical protein
MCVSGLLLARSKFRPLSIPVPEDDRISAEGACNYATYDDDLDGTGVSPHMHGETDLGSKPLKMQILLFASVRL